jgi:hypothetical protein
MRLAKCLFVFLMLFNRPVFSQSDEAKNIIEKLITKFLLVNTYQADAVIKPDISFLKILPQKATFYFRQPDQFRIKTNGISILPKQQFDNIFSMLTRRDAYISVLAGKEALKNGTGLSIVNIIPLADTSELILAKLWVDAAENLIVKAQLTTRSNGTVQIAYKHGKYAYLGLPDEIVFTIDVKKFKVPKALTADINTVTKTQREQENEAKQGKIYITISNYLINKSVPPEIFKN